jgi:probable addiction module antidote protein
MIQTKKYDSADYINTKEDVLASLDVALEENDTAFFLETVGIVARSKGMVEISKDLNLARESLYRSLSGNGNPSFDTVVKVIGNLGYRFQILPKSA